jgi:hypothetical protein
LREEMHAMTTKKREGDMEAMSQEIARMREDIAALAASMKNQAVSGVGEQEAFPEGDEQFRWADIRTSLDEARTRGEKALKDLSAEVERHPLGSIAAAIGVGFILAKIFGRGRS